MGIIAVIGTFLPLITEKSLISKAGAIICVGLAICCVGLWISTMALAKRDMDESILAVKTKTKTKTKTKEHNQKPVQMDEEADNNNEAMVQNRQDAQDGDDSESVANADDDDDVLSLRQSTKERKAMLLLKKKQDTNDYPTWKKIGICAATGICAVQLQFAFIFGEAITNLSLTNKIGKDGDVITTLPGSTHESGGAAIIWLLAISLSAPVAILNGIYSSSFPLSSAIRSPLSRHVKVICTTSLPWIAHIHIYGVCATTLLPSKVAASIGWPMLMMVTSGQALVLSVFLGEWKSASEDTIRTLKLSLGTSVVGIAILMSSVAASR